MPKASASHPLHFFLFKLSPKPRKPIHQTHFDEPTTPTNPFVKPTTPINPFRKPISQTPTGCYQSFSFCYLSSSLTLRCFSDFFVLIFVSLIVYIFWFSVIIYVWILRKCEKHNKNGFFRTFSGTQPNTRKYFPKHFLKCNQTLKNIFLSRKYFTPGKYFTLKQM